MRKILEWASRSRFALFSLGFLLGMVGVSIANLFGFQALDLVPSPDTLGFPPERLELNESLVMKYDFWGAESLTFERGSDKNVIRAPSGKCWSDFEYAKDQHALFFMENQLDTWGGHRGWSPEKIIKIELPKRNEPLDNWKPETIISYEKESHSCSSSFYQLVDVSADGKRLLLEGRINEAPPGTEPSTVRLVQRIFIYDIGKKKLIPIKP